MLIISVLNEKARNNTKYSKRPKAGSIPAIHSNSSKSATCVIFSAAKVVTVKPGQEYPIIVTPSKTDQPVMAMLSIRTDYPPLERFLFNLSQYMIERGDANL